MIWHIFRKDWKLLWPLVAIVAALQFMNAALQLALGHFGEPRELALIAQPFPYMALLGLVALIVTAVHQDAMPGDRQDWLVRPLRRRDLILAKLLFVLVAVHGPILLADLAHGMATGFSFQDSLSAAVSRGAFLLLSCSLPVLAIAAMTATIVEFIGGTLAILLIAIAIMTLIQALGAGGDTDHLASGGMFWMGFTFWSAVALAAAVPIIPLQYFRRATIQARGIALGATLLAPISQIVPWAPGFSLEQWLSPDPAAAKAISVAFDPSLGKFALEPGGRELFNPKTGQLVMILGGQSRTNSVWVPLRVSGLAPESVVVTDHAYVRIVGRDGAVLFRGRTTPANGIDPVNNFPVRTTARGDVRTHELITLPGKIYELARSQQVRMELDYDLTLFRFEASDTIAALNGDKRTVNFGWCKTRIDDDGDEVELGCVKLGNPPTCATAVLENTVSGQRNPPFNPCRPDYTPYAAHFAPDAMFRFGGSIPFSDPQGLAKYPWTAHNSPTRRCR